jgi:hypothetical protein
MRSEKEMANIRTAKSEIFFLLVPIYCAINSLLFLNRLACEYTIYVFISTWINFIWLSKCKNVKVSESNRENRNWDAQEWKQIRKWNKTRDVVYFANNEKKSIQNWRKFEGEEMLKFAWRQTDENIEVCTMAKWSK